MYICRQSREPNRLPNIEMPKMKRVRMPSPGEFVPIYLRSDFHSKRLFEILAMKIRVEISMDNFSR